MSIKSYFHFNVLAAHETVIFHDRLLSKLLRFPNLEICVADLLGALGHRVEGEKRGKSIRSLRPIFL